MLETSKQDGVTIVRMRHGKANALDVEMLEALSRELELMSAEPGGVVLTGSGGFFSAGVDLTRVLDSPGEYTTTLIEALECCLQQLYRLPRPVVAAINGHAIAGGLVLACACDYRVVGSPTAKLGLTELAVGIPFPPLAFEVVRQALRPTATRRLILEANLIDSRRAADLGVVDETVAADQVIDRAIALAKRWAALPGDTFVLTKRQLACDLDERLARYPAEELRAVEQAWSSAASRAAIERFMAANIGDRGS